MDILREIRKMDQDNYSIVKENYYIKVIGKMTNIKIDIQTYYNLYLINYFEVQIQSFYHQFDDYDE